MADDRIIELENNWKRALADYKNLEKRVSEERASFMQFANQGLILRLLSVVDNLELVCQHSPDVGLEMILAEFRQILKDEGTAEFEVIGTEFDPETMEAIEMIHASDKDNIVLEIVQKGYLFKNKVLRPARVKVGTKGGKK